ncbi:hypothetical protein Pmani_026606 [Petrolisthes manimaculis]|uniref:Uncharacterized protein n=1 Tax=Petrolisthes manimaculis TaxID=1843537 RepID=A0AAE1P346_9EUCA|nr:hypothetical protein Pmani_026606 [Petrolisthes manimaculis]
MSSSSPPSHPESLVRYPSPSTTTTSIPSPGLQLLPFNYTTHPPPPPQQQQQQLALLFPSSTQSIYHHHHINNNNNNCLYPFPSTVQPPSLPPSNTSLVRPHLPLPPSLPLLPTTSCLHPFPSSLAAAPVLPLTTTTTTTTTTD